MGRRPFRDMVRQQFAFLNLQYGFAGPYQLSDDNNPEGYGNYAEIEYRSETMIVTILRDRFDDLGVMLHPAIEPRGLSLGWVVEFFAGDTKALDIKLYVPGEVLNYTEEEFDLLIKAPKGEDTSRYRKKLSPAEVQRRDAWQEYRLSVYASALQKYCDPFLREDFSKWSELRKYVKQGIRNEFRARTGRELES